VHRLLHCREPELREIRPSESPRSPVPDWARLLRCTECGESAAMAATRHEREVLGSR